MKSDSQQLFLQAINEVEEILLLIGFKRVFLEKKGYATFIHYKRNDVLVEFMFGPSDWDVEMLIYTSKGKYAFKDLLEIPKISEWVNSNKYKQTNGRSIKDEIAWFIDLLKFALPIIE